MLTHLNHLTKLPLFLVESGIVLLLFSKLWGGLKQCLEISRVTPVFEEVDLGQKLLFLLLKLRDLFLEFCWIHAFVTQSLSILVHSLELGLQVLVALQGSSHLFINHIFIWDLKWYQKFSSVGLPGQIWQPWNKPVQNVMAGFFLSMNNISAIVWVKVTWVTENFQKSTDTLLSLLLSLLLHVYSLVLLVQVGENPVDELKKFEWCLVVELYHWEMTHERRPIEAIDDDFDFLGVEVGRFVVKFGTAILIASVLV